MGSWVGFVRGVSVSAGSGWILWRWRARAPSAQCSTAAVPQWSVEGRRVVTRRDGMGLPDGGEGGSRGGTRHASLSQGRSTEAAGFFFLSSCGFRTRERELDWSRILSYSFLPLLQCFYFTFFLPCSDDL
jgi:hypothetical protein